MPQGDWLRRATPIGVAVVFLVGLGIFLGRIDLEEHPKEYYKTRCKNGEYAYCDTQPRVLDPVSGELVPADPDDEEYRKEYREQKDLIAQQQMALWALAMFGATALGVVLLFQTLIATRQTVEKMQDANKAAWEAVFNAKGIGEAQIKVAERAANDQREIGQTAQAAFLSIASVETQNWPALSIEKIELRLKNIGLSAAFGIRFTVNVEAVNFGDFVQDGRVTALMSFGSFVYPSDDDVIGIGLDRSRILKGRESADYVRVFGAVLWDDIFGNARGIKFSYLASFAAIGPIARFYPSQYGNHILTPRQVEKLGALKIGEKYDLDDDDTDDL